ncbi:MAG: HAD-IIIC family phosphatase [Hyphomonadaceae bacterium]|nr:HAD-IIIC family phosphatase [Hyphomonadaceae bacterium]
MRWLPSPESFRNDLAAASATVDTGERLERLATLANTRLSYLELMQLDAALRKAPKPSRSRFETVRVAILASSTADHLIPAIRVAGLRRALLIETYVCPFGQVRQDLFVKGSALHAFSPDVVLFSLSTWDFLGAQPLDAPVAAADAAIAAAVNDIDALWREAVERFDATVIQQSFLDLEAPLFGEFDALAPAGPARLTARLNTLLTERAREHNVLWLDAARAMARDGRDVWFDPVRWLQAKMEIAPTAAPAFGELVARIVAALRGRSRKCLVLDLDNTLWGGVVGDDGVGGIVLGQGNPVGEAHLALQRYAKRLSERGVILAVCSKNDPAIAEAAFRDHPEMLLRREDFAAFVANWDDKAANLERIASQLNIGLDALVLVDDNPAERARVRGALPMVATPELPADPAHFVSCLADAGYFEATAFTEDDALRSAQYAANANREAARVNAGGMGAFLEQLQMTAVYGPVTPFNLARVTQLINKTNQFNTTGLRRTEAEVSHISEDPRALHLQFRLLDKFGDNGIVGAMLLTPHASDAATLELVNWVMSCRVFGRELEYEAMNILVDAARARGVTELVADHVKTERNGVVNDLFSQLGFAHAGDIGGGKRWVLRLQGYAPRRTCITRKAEADD